MLRNFYLIALVFFMCNPTHSEESRPKKFNINEPVENPNLVKALQDLSKDESTTNKDNVLIELNRSRFLIPILKEKTNKLEHSSDGSFVWDEESLLSVVVITGPDDDFYLPLFTDWTSLHNYIERPVDALVFSAQDAWDFSVNVLGYSRAVVNPGGNTLPLNEIQLKYLIGNPE